MIPWRIVLWVVTAGAIAAVAPPVTPADRTLHAPEEAVAFGLVAGVALFFGLARRGIATAALASVPRRRLLARSLVLTAKSVQEEALWRALVLGALVAPIGRIGALTISTVLFAAVHAGRQGRAAVAHLATGAVFGLSYLVTGRLLAATAAHASYNVLIGAATLVRDLSVLDTGRRARDLVASSTTLDRRQMSADHQPAVVVARLDAVVKSFGAVRALDRVDLTLCRGEVLALLGPNGAGKSTAVAVMLGLRRPDQGRARLNGGDPRSASSRHGVGAVLQDVSFPPALRVREVVEFVCAHFPAAASVEATLDRLELTSLAARQAAGLSGGQKRRLAVALALAGNPDILFLDEPTAGMDAATRRALLKDVAAFAARGGAVLLTTQQLAEAEEIATRVVVLRHGRVTTGGTVAQLRARGGAARVTVRATLLPPLSGVTSIDSQGDRHVLLAEDADVVVAELVRSGLPFRQLEVAPVSLEDAFVAITTEDAT